MNDPKFLDERPAPELADMVRRHRKLETHLYATLTALNSSASLPAQYAAQVSNALKIYRMEGGEL